MTKKTKITLISTLIILIFFSVSYTFGRPKADNIGYESKFYFIDQTNEAIYTFLSVSDSSRANKYISLLAERVDEFNNIINQEARNNLIGLFSDKCRKVKKYISRVSDEQEQIQLNKKLTEIIIDLLYADYQSNPSNKENSAAADELFQELTDISNKLPESVRKEIGKNKKDKINSIDKGGTISDTISDTIDNTDNDGDGDSDTDDGDNNFTYYPIESISREEIASIVSGNYKGDYILKTVNVLADKGYLCANIALEESFGALYLIRNTESGYGIDFIETDFDFSNIAKPDSITDVEWQWLLYNNDLNNEESINYY